MFTLGCHYRNREVKYMSMFGSVTDAQVFSRELSTEEMVEVTSCRQFLQGDILSWDREPWVLRSPWNRSEAELLDLERDVCGPRPRGYFLVPQPLTFTEAGHVCSKLAGAPASYTSEAEFSDLLRFLSLASNMRASACLDLMEDGSTGVQVWAGGQYEAGREAWTAWDTGRDVEVVASQIYDI